MAVTATPTQSTVKLQLNTGTSATGAATHKTMSLFSASLQKTSLDASGLEAAFNLAEIFEACLLYSLNAVFYEAQTSLSSGA